MDYRFFPKRYRWIAVLVGFTGISIVFDTSYVFAGTSPASEPPGFGSPWPYLLNLFFALAVVVVLAIILIRFLARRANIQQKGAILVLAARQLAPNRSVQVVEVGSKRYLLGVADEISLIADVTDTFTDEVNFSSNQSDGAAQFRQMLQDKLSNLRETYRPQGSKEDDL